MESDEEMELRMAEQEALMNVSGEIAEDYLNRYVDLNAVVEKVEISNIERALIAADYNQTNAAKLLKLNRTTLLAKMKKYNIRP